jgi:hypothetical protein
MDTEQDWDENQVNEENAFLRKSSLHIKGMIIHSLSLKSESSVINNEEQLRPLSQNTVISK